MDYAGPILTIVGTATGQNWITAIGMALTPCAGGVADPAKAPQLQPPVPNTELDP